MHNRRCGFGTFFALITLGLWGCQKGAEAPAGAAQEAPPKPAVETQAEAPPHEALLATLATAGYVVAPDVPFEDEGETGTALERAQSPPAATHAWVLRKEGAFVQLFAAEFADAAGAHAFAQSAGAPWSSRERFALLVLPIGSDTLVGPLRERLARP